MPIALTGMDSGANSTNSVGESTPPPPPPNQPAAMAAKGRSPRRWRRIPREQLDEGSPPAGPVAAAAAATDQGLAQLHKRRPPVGADGPKGKHSTAAEAESPAASVESSFVPPEVSPSPAPTTLDSDLGLLIASTGFSLGPGSADSDNSDDRTAKSSTSLPRHDLLLAGFGRERDRARSRAPGASAHSKNLRSVRVRGASARAASAASSAVEAENSRSSVESDLRSSGAAHARKSSSGISSNGVHKFLYTDVDHSDEEPPSEELRSEVRGFYKENGRVVGRLVMGNGDSYATGHVFVEGSLGKGENGGIHSGLDPYVQSIASLQSAQEALEKEIQNFVEIGKETSESANTSEVKLRQMVQKLESRCKELANTSEVLKLQARASRASLFCSVQLVLLCIAVGTFVVRFLPSPPELLPT